MRSDQTAPTRLSSPEGASRTNVATSILPELRSSLGRYVVLCVLGQGAMGVILAAYDPELDRKVALKLLKHSKHGDEEYARLRREAQALARLNHENVVSVYEVGTHEERAFVAMEFVRGKTLRQWLHPEDRGRSWAEVVDVFLAAGRGLAAAHHVGLIHRDFKPDNVMIADDGRVRVMDFGLARLGDGSEEDSALEVAVSSTDDTASTSLEAGISGGGAWVGTPAYMAPEQFLGKSADIRSDLFAFCVGLFEALYGSRPLIEDTDPIANDVGLQAQIKQSTHRVPGWVAKEIVRGLSIKPAERHASMDELLAALSNSPTRRRRRLYVAAAMLGTLGAGVWFGVSLDRNQAEPASACAEMDRGLVGVWDSQRRAEVEARIVETGKHYAAGTWESVEAALDTYTENWVAARTEACLADAEGVQSGELFDRKIACLDQRLTRVRATVELLSEMDVPQLENAIEAVSGLPGLARCADTDALMAAQPRPEDPRLAALSRALEDKLAAVATRRAFGDLERGLEIAVELVAEAKVVGYAPIELNSLYLEGALRTDRGELDLASEILEDVYARALALEMVGIAGDSACALMHLHGVERVDSVAALPWKMRADVLSQLGQGPEARLSYLVGAAQLSLALGKYAESEAMFERALERMDLWVGEGAFGYGLAHTGLATARWRLGDYDRGRAGFERALAYAREHFGPSHPRVAGMLINLSIMEVGIGEYSRARDSLERALAIYELSFGPDSPQVYRYQGNLGSIALLSGDFKRARAIYEDLLPRYEVNHGPEHPAVAALIGNLGEVSRSEGLFEQALREQERAQALFEAAVGPEHPALILVSIEQAKNLLGLDRPGDAIAPLERALALLADQDRIQDNWGHALFCMARARWDAPEGKGRDRARALEHARDARERVVEGGVYSTVDLVALEAWIATHAAAGIDG